MVPDTDNLPTYSSWGVWSIFIYEMNASRNHCADRLHITWLAYHGMHIHWSTTVFSYPAGVIVLVNQAIM